MKLEIDNDSYKIIQLFFVLLVIPSIISMVIGVSLFSNELLVFGYIFVLLGVCGTIFSISSVFDYFTLNEEGYDWGKHVRLVDKDNYLLVRNLPMKEMRINLQELEDIDIVKTDVNCSVTFETQDEEINILFTVESYDSLLELKQIYVTGS